MRNDFGSVAKCVPFYIRKTEHNSSSFSCTYQKNKEDLNLLMHKAVADEKTRWVTAQSFLACDSYIWLVLPAINKNESTMISNLS